jgi:transcriptional regulator with XRE-family HTH domain
VETLQQQFGNLIRRRRHAAGLGQEALADKALLHRTHVSLLERGKRMPSLLVIQKLAAALGTTMADLMRELEEGGERAGEVPEAVTPKKRTKRRA